METTINLPRYEDNTNKDTFGPGDSVYVKWKGQWLYCHVQTVSEHAANLTKVGYVPASMVYAEVPSSETTVETLTEELVNKMKEDHVFGDLCSPDWVNIKTTVGTYMKKANKLPAEE